MKMPFFVSKLSKLEKIVLELEPIRRQFLNARAANALCDIIAAYFSPFILSEEARDHCKDSIERFLTH